MADNLPPSSADVTESGSLNLPEPCAPHRPIMGLLYLYLLHCTLLYLACHEFSLLGSDCGFVRISLPQKIFRITWLLEKVYFILLFLVFLLSPHYPACISLQRFVLIQMCLRRLTRYERDNVKVIHIFT
jgi:hypothetical protein